MNLIINLTYLNRSTISVLQIIEYINTAFKEKVYALVACIDLEKHLTVNHNALLMKMANLGITRSVLNWAHNFLNGRTCKIKIGNQSSIKGKKSNGVPQGSQLSPTLFKIMMTDLKFPEDITKIIYADDRTILTSNKHLIETET